MKYIFFDLDGTLLNTGEGIITSIERTLEDVGIPAVDRSVLRRHVGPPLKAGFMQFYQVDDVMADKMVEVYREHYHQYGIPGTKLYEGIPEMLQALCEAGYRLIVATSKPEEISKRFLEGFDLTKYFEDICGSGMDGSRDTKAEVIHYALERNQITDPKEVLMVGDRSHDVEGAKAERIDCVGVTYGYGSEEELRNAGAIEVVDTPAELVDYLKQNLVVRRNRIL